MGKSRDRERLTLETRDRLDIARETLRQNLDRDVAAEPRVPRLLDPTHAPRPDR